MCVIVNHNKDPTSRHTSLDNTIPSIVKDIGADMQAQPRCGRGDWLRQEQQRLGKGLNIYLKIA